MSSIYMNTINLRLPHRITDAPQTGDRKEDQRILRMRPPEQHNNDNRGVHHGAQCNDHRSSDVLHDRSEDDRANGVHHSETDHHIADGVDAQSARHIRLLP